MSKPKFDGMSLAEVARVRASLVEDMEELKTQLNEASDEILRRLEATIQAEYSGRGVQHGLVRFEKDGVSVAVEIRKTVKWDQTDLRELSNRLPPEVNARIFDVELGIKERLYDAMARTDLPLYTALGQARTVKYSPPAIKQIEVQE